MAFMLFGISIMQLCTSSLSPTYPTTLTLDT
jgi:hypothetical protein